MRHLHNRPLIHLPRPHDIIQHRKQNDGPRHQHAEIHSLGLHRRGHGPEAEKENDDPKCDRERIDQDAKDARKMKRPPHELVSRAAIVRDVRRVPDCARAPAPKEEALGDEVGGVEAADAEGDDVVEGGGGAEVDEADEAGDEGCDDDGEQGDGGFGLDLRRRAISVKGKCAMTGREGLSGRTLLTVRHPGRPRSRANAQIKRDAVAMNAMVAATFIMIMMAIKTDAPALEPVAS